MNGDFQSYLEQERDSSLIGSLAAHDRRFHPKGYHSGDTCMYRDRLGAGDKVDEIGGGGSAADGLRLLGRWVGAPVRFVGEKEAAREFLKLDDDARAFITQEEFRAWSKVVGYYLTRTSEQDNPYPADYRHAVLNRVPAVVAECFKRAGFDPAPTKIEISFKVMDKILGKSMYSNKVENNEDRNRSYWNEKGLGDEEVERNVEQSTHTIPVQQIRKIQTAIDDPVAVFESPDEHGSGKYDETLTVLTNIVDPSTGHQAILPLRYRYDEHRGVAKLEVSTMYGRIGDIRQYVSRSPRVYYVKDKTATGFPQSSTHQRGSQVGNSRGSVSAAKSILTQEDFAGEMLGQILSKEDLECQSGAVRKMLGKDSRIAGWYDRKTGDVTLVKGRADAKTVAHEIGWHATFHWAEKNMPALHDKLLRYAKEAPSAVVESVIARYGEKLSPEALLDEIGAERFTREHMGRIADEIERRKADGWWDDVEDGQKRLSEAFVGKEGNRVLSEGELRQIADLPPSEAVARLVGEMIGGRSIGSSRKSVRNFNRGALKEFLGGGVE